MIVFLDTSAFFKLYVEEAGTHETRQLVDVATAVSVHMITYAEMCAAFAQAVRMGRLTDAQRQRHKKRFDQDWETLQVLTVDDTLIRRAGRLAESFELRGFDSVQLAAAERVWWQVRSNFVLATFDDRVIAASRTLGMEGIN